MDDSVLLQYLDGDLDEQIAAEIADQLRNDPALQRRIEELRETEAADKAVPEKVPTREEMIDEALEETFPASDPPFWMPLNWKKSK